LWESIANIRWRTLIIGQTDRTIRKAGAKTQRALSRPKSVFAGASF
jgi:hypothetical protein